MNLIEFSCEPVKLGLSGSGQETVSDCWEHGNDVLDFVKDEQFID